MASNVNLAQAKAARDDEFYTQLADIERELHHYRQHFRGKIVFCNCDDPFESDFFKYFALSFNWLGIKKLIATCYASSPIAARQLSLFDVNPAATKSHPYKAIVTRVYDTTGTGMDMLDVAELFKNGENELTELEGDGDFRSRECQELLDEADIVVTNPPFSLFREFITMLMAHKKQFVILGPQSGVKYKETFPLIREGKMWLGYNNGDMSFRVPDYYEPRKSRYWQDESGQKWRSMGNMCWFTNLDISKRHEEMILYRYYSPDTYFSYTNFDGIDVPKIADIPCDYVGNMGVPITFLEQHNPEQFEIVGLGEGHLAREMGTAKSHDARAGSKLEVQYPDGSYHRPYARIVVRNKHPEKPRS